MAAGLQIFNADGSLQVDIDTRLMRTLTSATFATGTADGSAVISGVEQGDVVAVANTSTADGVTPTITKNANGVAWTFGSSPGADRRSVDVTVVVY